MYSRSSKSSVQHILTYLPSYCKNNICGEWVVYAETVTYIAYKTTLAKHDCIHSSMNTTSSLDIQGNKNTEHDHTYKAAKTLVGKSQVDTQPKFIANNIIM